MTMQDVDRLFMEFIQVRNVREISRLMRTNTFIFDQPLNPVLASYLHFVDVHMPEGNLKEACKSIGEACKVWGAIGSEVMLSEMDGIVQQPGPAPWSLANTATIAAARKKYQPSSDQRLIGHWRRTDSMSSGGFSYVTDYNHIFDENGQFKEYSHTVSASLGTNRRTMPVNGKWSTQDNVITIQFPDGTTSQIAYHLEGNTLYYPNNGSIWSRVS
jgi:hypothetical protein